MMKNLKLNLVLLLAIISSTTLFSQGFYLTAGGGYAVGVNSRSAWMQNRTYNGYNNEQTGEFSFTEEYANVPFSLGKGVNFGLSVGFMFNDYFGVDLGGSYLMGGKSESVSLSNDTRIDGSGNTLIRKSKGVASIYSKMWRIIPSLVLTPNFEKWNPFMRIGAVIGFGSFYMDYESDFDDYLGVANTFSTKSEFNKGVAIGVNATMGVNYVLNQKVSLFGEVSYIGLSFAPSKWKQTEYKRNGIDELPQQNRSQTEVDYVDSYVYDRNNVNPDEPQKQLKESFPFSSIGFNIGVKFNL